MSLAPIGPRRALVAAWLTVLHLAGPAPAASPVLNAVRPPGAQRGTELDVIFVGDRLGDARDVLFYRPGIRVLGMAPQGDKGKQARARLAIDTDCRPGEVPFRLRTASGLSDLRVFYVGPLPSVDEREPNDTFETPQAIPLDVTVNGVVKNEDVDYFAVEAREGDRLTAELEGIRLAAKLFDPYVAILDSRGFPLAVSDDSALLRQDPVASVLAPADGTYVVQVRESAYGGSDQSVYRLHVGTFPRPRAVYPPGGPAGGELEVRLLGDVKGPFIQRVRLNAEPGRQPVVAVQNGGTAPSPNWVQAAAFPNVLEAEPNDGRDQATAAAAPPVAFNGIIDREGDRDWFSFTAKKNRQFHLRVVARQLRSPLDSVLEVFDASGKSLQQNDDAGGPDSYVKFRAPADGTYALAVRDHLGNGGATYVYRVECEPVGPVFTLQVPQFRRNTQDQQSIPVPQGNRYATRIRVVRESFNEALVLAAAGLPPGVKLLAPELPSSVKELPLVFEADGDAAVGGQLIAFDARSANSEKQAAGRLVHRVDLVREGNTVYHHTEVAQLALAVTEPAPFSVSLAAPPVPLVPGGSMELRVSVRREAGFDEPIRVKLLYRPPGLGADAEIRIPKGETEAVYRANAEVNAPLQRWPLAVTGSAKVNGGDLWVASDFVELEVAEPYLAGALDLFTVVQGGQAEVVCRLEQRKPFAGPARARLLGLPRGVTAEDCELTSDDEELVFTVRAGEKSPVGKHATLFCSVEVPERGHAIPHSIGGKGTLRIDPPPKQKPAASQAPTAPAVTQQKEAAPRRLSRLEQLRQAQQPGGNPAGGG